MRRYKLLLREIKLDLNRGIYLFMNQKIQSNSVHYRVREFNKYQLLLLLGKENILYAYS